MRASNARSGADRVRCVWATGRDRSRRIRRWRNGMPRVRIAPNFPRAGGEVDIDVGGRAGSYFGLFSVGSVRVRLYGNGHPRSLSLSRSLHFCPCALSGQIAPHSTFRAGRVRNAGNLHIRLRKIRPTGDLWREFGRVANRRERETRRRGLSSGQFPGPISIRSGGRTEEYLDRRWIWRIPGRL